MPTLRDLQHRAEYWFIRSSAFLLSLLPIDLAVGIVARLVAVVGPWTSLHARALRNLGVAFPDWPEAEHRRVAAAMWRHTGRTIGETLLLQRIVADASRLEIDGRPALEQSFREHGAHVGITLHMGNWEIAGVVCAICGGRLAGIYRPLRNPYLDGYLRKTRDPLYPGGLLFKGAARESRPNKAAAVAAMSLLRRGGYLAAVCDQVDETSGFTVPFFGQQSTFTPAPAVFARHADARIWIARCLRRDDRSRFRIEIKELLVERVGDRRTDLRNVTAAMAAQFELWIRDTPEQWMWWQRRSISG